MGKVYMDCVYDLAEDILLLKHNLFDQYLTRRASNYYFEILHQMGPYINTKSKIKKSLFQQGGLIKIYSEHCRRPSFFPAPPIFIMFADDNFNIKQVMNHKHAIDTLEKQFYELTFQNMNSLFRHKLVYIEGRDVSFVAFMMYILKHFTQKKSYLTLSRITARNLEVVKWILGTQFPKVNLMVNRQMKGTLPKHGNFEFINPLLLGNTRTIIIDDNYLFEVLRIKNDKGWEADTYLGYFTTQKEVIIKARERLELLIRINGADLPHIDSLT